MHPSELRPGTVVARKAPVAAGLMQVDHVGIVTDRRHAGLPCVISASKRTGRVLEESWADFTQGEAAHVVDWQPRIPVRDVLRRARAKIGQEWNLIWSNCEHFVTWGLGYEEQSPQLKKALVGIGIAAGVAVVVGGAIAVASESEKKRGRRRS